MKKALHVPVLANGNLRNIQDAQICLEATGADASTVVVDSNLPTIRGLRLSGPNLRFFATNAAASPANVGVNAALLIVCLHVEIGSHLARACVGTNRWAGVAGV